MANLAFANVDIALRLTSAILRLYSGGISAVLQRHIPNRLQVTQVPLIRHPVLGIKFCPVGPDGRDDVRGLVRVGEFIGAAVGAAGRVSCIDRSLPQRDLPVLADKLFNKKLLLSRQLGVYGKRLAAPGLDPVRICF